jgi:putative Holliday junction resolvase
MIAGPLSLVRKTKFTDDAHAVLKLMDGRKASGW